MFEVFQPPLTLAALPPDNGQHGAAVWPTPDLPGFPAASRLPEGTMVALEGLNGRVIEGRLSAFDPAAGSLQLRPHGGRSELSLRLEQFRRLRIDDALRPVPPADARDLADERALLPFSISFKGGAGWSGETAGQHSVAWGVYLFEPIGDDGSVRRWFVPRAACEHIDIGRRLGQTLVDQQALKPEQLQSALSAQQTLRTRRLGDVMLVRQLITPEELAQAIAHQAQMPMVRIGEALIALGLIDQAELDAALLQQRSDRGTPLGELLVRQGVVSRADLQTALARKMGYPLVDVLQFPADAEAVTRLPYAVASRVVALPLMLRAGRLVVALDDPSNRTRLDELEFAAQCKVVPVLAAPGALIGAIDRAYQKVGAADFAGRPVNPDAPIEFEPQAASALLATMEQAGENTDTAAEDAITQSDNTLVRLINSMIVEAHKQGVSDVHIECAPGREKVRIRFRHDGQLRPYLELPSSYRNAILSRLKIMCDLDISERRKPQDGKINFGKFVQGMQLELRVATIPTHSGLEDAVIRLLAANKAIALDALGLAPHNLDRIRSLSQRPYGMLLCVGPTGSGKTTTLHSVLGHINQPERKIWTAEDPIEITQPGLRQVQVNPKIDWTFAKALRAFLRADPDVIMVGEIRDSETAQVAIEASLTGHLVLSTLHTNSAPETVTRLLDMGMDPFNFADALLGVLAQRLVRRLCLECRSAHLATVEEEDELIRDWLHVMDGVPATPDHEALRADWRQRFGQPAEGAAPAQADAASQRRIALYRPVGCKQCADTGWRGRAGIHEFMTITRSLRQRIQGSSRADELQRHALGDGMRTLRQDGIDKVLAGVTTIEEVRANS